MKYAVVLFSANFSDIKSIGRCCHCYQQPNHGHISLINKVAEKEKRKRNSYKNTHSSILKISKSLNIQCIVVHKLLNLRHCSRTLSRVFMEQAWSINSDKFCLLFLIDSCRLYISPDSWKLNFDRPVMVIKYRKIPGASTIGLNNGVLFKFWSSQKSVF